MPHLSQFTLLDYSDEKSRVEIYNGAITTASLAGFLTQFGAMRTAIDNITLGTLQQESWVGDRTVLSNETPTNNFAQRELKWRVVYKGNTSQKLFQIEVPTADPTGRLLPKSDRANLTQGQMAAFVTAFQDIARSPEDDTENVTVQYIQLVGRNL